MQNVLAIYKTCSPNISRSLMWKSLMSHKNKNPTFPSKSIKSSKTHVSVSSFHGKDFKKNDSDCVTVFCGKFVLFIYKNLLFSIIDLGTVKQNFMQIQFCFTFLNVIHVTIWWLPNSFLVHFLLLWNFRKLLCSQQFYLCIMYST